MISDLQRLLDALRKRPNAVEKSVSGSDIQSARSALLRSVKDCSGEQTQSLHRRIALAGTHRELWALRADAYNVIAKGHCQSVAAERIHDMAHFFHGWVDQTEMLSRVPAKRPPRPTSRVL